ncbi:hypothetical protein QJS10_CPB18g01977 [Acorus calamus]|uniref:Uncharacterized protein n=1 Tax=Acorus calamus TaxID=4465 RepID=A0AAV9CLU8_ACOCL|nr:hypothetical protein QJS10_CPB18g01977 [Acorus calamus]
MDYDCVNSSNAMSRQREPSETPSPPPSDEPTRGGRQGRQPGLPCTAQTLDSLETTPRGPTRDQYP